MADSATSKKAQQQKPLRLVFLDVDGVLHPLGPNHLPKGADVEQLGARVDEDLA